MNSLNQFFAKRLLKDAFSEEKALFLSTLMQNSREGHLCLKTSKVPELPASILQEGKDRFPTTAVVRQGDRYYLQRNWVYETYILEQVKRLRTLKSPPHPPFEQNSTLLPHQRMAIDTAIQNMFSIICGGPGTGKTYTAAILIRFLAASSPKQNRYKVALAAPTGKAAFHLQAILDFIGAQVEATTLHRLLKIVPGESKLFSHRKIDADLVVVDEASMLDVPLFAQLLESIGDQTRLVLMGDPDQLPPIEAGSLFAEMAALFGVRLEQSMRTDNAHLLHLAAAIHRGKFPDTPLPFDETLTQKLFQVAAPFIFWDEPDPGICLQNLAKFRILGALRQGSFGIDSLNQQIVQEMGRLIRPGQWWAIPIMITKNEPSQDLYNGSSGILIGKSRGDIYFYDSIAYFPEKVPFKNLPPFEIAFCLSIHKSQGSEFERVLALFPQGSERFGKEALYTAVTRAKKEVQIAVKPSTLSAMLSHCSNKISGFTDRFLTTWSSGQ